MIIAIDPGTTESAILHWSGQAVLHAEIMQNAQLREWLSCHVIQMGEIIAVEGIASYGMAVGKEVFETCYQIGRCQQIIEQRGIPFRLVYRLEVKMHHCHSARAKDANLRQSLLDAFGGKDKAMGKKIAPGPFYGVKSHLWSALAIALYVESTRTQTDLK